jgi:hypothetical protein
MYWIMTISLTRVDSTQQVSEEVPDNDNITYPGEQYPTGE